MVPAVVQAGVTWPETPGGWPALILEIRILTCWSILAGLSVKFLVVLGMTRLQPMKRMLATLAMNAASTLAGIVLIPIAGLLIAYLLQTRSIADDDPLMLLLAWTITLTLAVAVNTGIELSVLRCFAKDISRKKMCGWLLAANMVTVGLAFGSLYLYPPNMLRFYIY